MKKIQWKVSAAAVTLIVAAALLFAGCSDSDSGSSGSNGGGNGVLGQVAGVVYDNVTSTPVADVDVAIPGHMAVKTGADGSYLINDVAVGTHTATFVKEGYGFTSRTVFVDPNAYNTIDPFKENAILSAEVELFTAWLTTNEIPGYFAEDNTPIGSESTWAYSNGSFFNGDGAVTYNEATKKFEWSNKKLNYSYSHAVPLGLIGLAPLNASLKATIELVFAPYSAEGALTVPVNNVAPVGEVIKVWLLDATYMLGETIGTAPQFEPPFADVNFDPLYGPFTTGADGSFTADKLPANTEFTLIIDKFSQEYAGSTFYFANSVFYAAPVVGGNLTTLVATDLLKTQAGEEAVNAGRLYLFTDGDVAFVTATNAANAGAPLGVNEAISVTFSKPIDTNSFTASISIESVNVTASITETTLHLKASWDEAKKVATLTPDEKFASYSKIQLPYSKTETTKVGDLTLAGRALDSSEIYTGALPVFTKGGIKLESIEVLAPNPELARAAYVVTKGGTIKLTFNKPVAVALTANFTLSGSSAHYKVDGNSIYVWVDAVFDEDVDLGYPAIYSSEDSSDAIGPGTIGDISSAEGRKLVLIGTNLYDNPDGVTPITPDVTDNFALDGKIELEFASIPADSRVKAELWAAGTPTLVYTTSGISGNKVTVTPASRLKAGTTYGLKVLIENSGTVLWETPDDDTSLTTHANIGGNSISLSTIPALTVQAAGAGSKTNISVTAANNNFDANSDIYLDFNRPLKALGANAVKIIYDATGKETPVTSTLEGDDRILKISPTRLLAPNENFTIRLNLESKDGQLYARDTEINGDENDYANGAAYNTNISFDTAATPRWGTGLKSTGSVTLSRTTATAVPKGNTDVQLRLSGLTASLVNRNFTVYRTSAYDIGHVDGVAASVAVANGATTQVDFTADLNNTVASHLTAENQIFYIRGVDDFGTVIAGQIAPITFAP
jgi:hypothetical protein